MIKKLIASLALSMLFVTGAHAATMSLVGPASVVDNQTFDVEIWGDFAGEGLIAGGITFNYTAGLMSLNSITLNLPVVADFSCPGSPNCPPPSDGSAPIVWGEFLADLIGVGDGPTLMATLSFTANLPTEAHIATFSMLDNPALTGGWFGAGFSGIPTPTFGELQTTVVPLPAAVWFMIGGLGTLLGFRRS